MWEWNVVCQVPGHCRDNLQFVGARLEVYPMKGWSKLTHRTVSQPPTFSPLPLPGHPPAQYQHCVNRAVSHFSPTWPHFIWYLKILLHAVKASKEDKVGFGGRWIIDGRWGEKKILWSNLGTSPPNFNIIYMRKFIFSSYTTSIYIKHFAWQWIFFFFFGFDTKSKSNETK